MREIEIWTPIEGFERFEISNLGRVKNTNWRNTGKVVILKGFSSHGYTRVNISKNGKTNKFFVHRLVAEHFVLNPLNLPHVNHKNEDKTDNRACNLEWCDPTYNINYGSRNKRVSEKMTNGKTSKPVIQYTLNGEFVCEWPSTKECGRNGFNRANIAACCRGVRKSAHGYIWKYREEA